ncbi:unnamed protein product [Closterium sp. Yama58-4]|nr:unnamed protein product [Closterium sp. Yama58-4]
MSDASTTIPKEAGSIRKGEPLFIKGRPCMVVEISTKVGAKHGRTACHFVGTDIITNETVEDTVPSTHICDVPVLSKDDYQLVSLDDDGFVTVTTPEGDIKTNLHLPTNEALASKIKNGLEEGKELAVRVMSYTGEEATVE